MKRTWIIAVGAGIGHELNNQLSEADLYGPFTMEQAIALEKQLEGIISAAKLDSQEDAPCIYAIPLNHLSAREVLKVVKLELAEAIKMQETKAIEND